MSDGPIEIIRGVIEPYVGATMARASTDVHCRSLGIDHGEVPPERITQLIDRLEKGLKVFLGAEKTGELMGEMRRRLSDAGHR